jgi:hypothetical protein
LSLIPSKPREEAVVAKERRIRVDGQRGHGGREGVWCMRRVDAEVICVGGFRGE